ncbi:MAG: hypothetical protein GKR90_20220 [Pseudomonadales bacterium]|nr:hypothetical protein [Pseudomonadales bacterium]
MTENKIRHAFGGAILLLGILTYGYSDQTLFNAASWILMATGAYLITQAFFAIVFTVFAVSLALYFSGRNTDQAILVMMIASGSLATYSLVSRFFSRVKETRAERWRHRDSHDS